VDNQDHLQPSAAILQHKTPLRGHLQWNNFLRLFGVYRVEGRSGLFGGNDDAATSTDSYYWVDPGGDQGYGAIWVGNPDNVFQG